MRSFLSAARPVVCDDGPEAVDRPKARAFSERIDGMLKAILILHLLLLCLPAWAGDREDGIRDPILISGNPAYPPFMWRDGSRIVGVGTDLTVIILSRLNQPYENRYVGPWKRVKENARLGEVDLVVGIYRNPEREAYLDFSEPYCDDPTSIFTLKEKTFSMGSRQDLVPLRGVTRFGESYGASLDRFIAAELKMSRVYSTDEMFDRLFTGKVDYLLFGYYPTRILSIRKGFEDRIAVVEKNLAVENIHLAISKQSRYRKLLPDINQLLRKLRSDGTIEALIQKHMSRYFNRSVDGDATAGDE